MKKAIGTVGLVMIMSVSLVACGPKASKDKQNEGNSVIQQITDDEGTNFEDLNSDFAVNVALNAISNVSGLTEMATLTDESAEALYSFGKFSGLEKEIRSVETESEFREIALVKIEDENQTAELYSIMLKRLADLKAKYADNEKVSEILNNPESMRIRQQDGILIFILAENAGEIEMELDEMFN